MKLYRRDYNILTIEEIEKWEKLKKEELFDPPRGNFKQRSLYRQYPKAVRHFTSLFPNNLLDVVDLKNEDELHMLVEKYLDEINKPAANERSIARFIKENNAYFIIGSIVKKHYGIKYFNFGHHGLFVFPEFMLGATYKVDYLIVGMRSGGYEFILVELEAPGGKITQIDGELGDAFRKGMKQVRFWESWLESYYTSFNETFLKYKNLSMELPQEFLRLDKTRFHYVVIAGRRDDFNDNTYRIQRKTVTDQNILLLHYDNLLDSALEVIGSSTY